ncbi:MAG: hypothetical protein HYZ75_07320 [Elusimicrobia bacterium]|nr:hypothetical protein [Elusimicrobiota bacterium]
MTYLRLLPAVLACVILGAHFLRGGHVFLAAGLAAFPFALALREPWVKRAFEILLGVGAMVWVATALDLGAARMAADAPWLRMACILGGVAAFNGLAILLLQGDRMRGFFRSG